MTLADLIGDVNLWSEVPVDDFEEYEEDPYGFDLLRIEITEEIPGTHGGTVGTQHYFIREQEPDAD